MVYTKEERENIKKNFKEMDINPQTKKDVLKYTSMKDIREIQVSIMLDEEEEAKLLKQELDKEYKSLPWYKKLIKIK